MHNFQDIYNRLPPAWGVFPADGPHPEKQARAIIHVWLLLSLEQENLYSRLTQAPPVGENDDEKRRVWHLASTAEAVVTYVSPMDFTSSDGVVNLNGAVYGIQNYAANIRVFGPLSGSGAQPGVDPATDSFDGVPSLSQTFPDGTSNVIIFATRYAQCGLGSSTWSQIGTATLGPFGGYGAFFGSNISPKLSDSGDNSSGDDTTFQVAPSPATCNPTYAQSFDNRSLQVALADGSARYVSPTVSIRTWSRAVIRNDGYDLDADW